MDARQDVLTVAPGAITLVASWLGLLNTLLSTAFIGASLAFLIWRWRRAVNDRKQIGE